MNEDPRIELFEALYADPDVRPRLVAMIEEWQARRRAPVPVEELERMWLLSPPPAPTPTVSPPTPSSRWRRIMRGWLA